jgi:hypothetical protein
MESAAFHTAKELLISRRGFYGGAIRTSLRRAFMKAI